MADNTLNFDLDAPAVPTLTLDPTPAAVPQEEKPAAAPAPEAQVNLTPEEQAMVDQFAQKIDITNSQHFQACPAHVFLLNRSGGFSAGSRDLFYHNTQ